jgi:hypothetical protein
MNARVLIFNEPKNGKNRPYLATGEQPIRDQTRSKILGGGCRIRTMKKLRVVSNDLNNPGGFTTKSTRVPLTQGIRAIRQRQSTSCSSITCLSRHRVFRVTQLTARRSPPEPKKRKAPSTLRSILGMLVAVLSSTRVAVGANQPAVNLGFTSFLDGVSFTPSGFVYQVYTDEYGIDRIKVGENQSVSIPDKGRVTANVVPQIHQFIYKSPLDILGFHPGVEVILPFLLEANMNPSGVPSTARRPYGSQTGFGDLVIGPFLQSGVMTLNGRPFFSNQLEFTLASPTGAYDKTKIINPGHNTWDLNPFWAATLFWTPKLTSSIRAHYLWSSRNPATGYKSGQAFHMNFASAYEILKNFRIGVNGYIFQQFTDDNLNGRTLHGSESRVLGIGPGLMYAYGAGTKSNLAVFLNTYFETAAANFPEGFKFNFRLVHAF